MRRVLSIDGGGLKGVFPAAFLATVEEAIGEPVAEYFLIVGTSTGGIIALGLATAGRITAAAGRKVSVISADLSTKDGVRSVEERLAADESIDTVVNNAGIALFGPVPSADPAQLDKLVAINVGAFTRVAAAAAKAFTGRGKGTIINISSAFALYITPFSTAQSASKSYVLTFTQGLAHVSLVVSTAAFL